MQSHQFAKFKHWGIVLDLPPEEVPDNNWTRGINFIFKDTATKRVGGYQEFAPGCLFPPIFNLNVTFDGVSYWLYCGETGVGVTDGTNHWDITPATGITLTPTGSWVGTVLNGIPCFTNGLDAPFYWSLATDTPCETLPGWPDNTICTSLRAFKYHLFAINVTSEAVHYGDSLWWSEGVEPGAIPQDWLPAPDNDAGDMVLADSNGDIVDALPMRDTLIVYKGSATYSISYVAGQYVYTQRKNFLTTGVQSVNCVVEINGNHWVFTGSDLIQHDGQSYQSIIQYKAKEFISNSVDPQSFRLSQLVQRNNVNQLWLCVPQQGETRQTIAMVVNTDTQEVGFRTLPNTASIGKGVAHALNPDVAWDGDPDSWESDPTFWGQAAYNVQDDSLVMCVDGQSKLFIVDTIDSADGEPITAEIERIALHINEQDVITRRLVVSVVPRIIGNAGDIIYIMVGSQDFFETPVTWSDPVPFTIGQDVAINCHVEGRMHSIRFFGTTVGKWSVHSYQLRYADQGLY